MADDQVYGSGNQGWGAPGQPAGTPPAGANPYVPAGYAPQSTPGATPAPPPAGPQGSYVPPAQYGQQGPYPPQGPYTPQVAYGQQGYYGQAAPPRTPAIAIVGLVLAFVVPPVGLIVSLVAVGKAKLAGAGRGLTTAGIIVGTLLTLAGAAVIPFAMKQFGSLNEAKQAVVDMTDSLENRDCDQFMANSTERFQELLGVASCDDFSALVDLMSSGPVPIGNVPITGAELTDGVATVTTLERMATGVGTETTLQHFDYTVIERDGEWLVDYVQFAE